MTLTKSNIIISLTSYPARINTVNETICTLINQTIQADKIVLWLNPELFPNKESDLPNNLLELRNNGIFEIRWYHNIKSYTKLIPSLLDFPNDIIVTADDDILYPPNWLESLYNGYKLYPNSIQCHRAFKVRIKNKKILPYKEWYRGEIINGRGAMGVLHSETEIGFMNFFTGVSGVLYPPHCLHKDVFNEKIFMNLAATEDDVWFWIMALKNGTCINVVENNMGLLSINKSASQEFALYNINSKNDTTGNIIKQLFNLFPDVYKRIVNQPQLIISLTSYPARINTVHLTIESLINQTKKADKIILWLSPEQFPNYEQDLPKQLRQLIKNGLIIDWYHDIKSYKKLIPTLHKYPNSIIITADDDIIYRRTWLKKLYQEHLRHPHDIICHRVTKFIYKNNKFVTLAGGKHYYHGANVLNKLVGVGGVLYPSNCFASDILNEKLFMSLAPTNDDQWFWVQAMLNGTKVRVARGKEIKLKIIQGTQSDSLCAKNDNGPKLFWRDFYMLMDYYPSIHKLLVKKAGAKSFFKKERKNDGTREIYCFGKKIFSYNRKTVLNNKISVRYISKDRLPIFLSDKFFERTGKLPTENLDTFSEKIIWSGMFDVSPLKTQCTDKVAVRDYVRKTIGEKYLPKIYAVYKNSDELNFNELPKSFFLVYNAGSGSDYNKIIKDKNTVNEYQIKQDIKKWFLYNTSEPVCEMQYRDIPPRVMARELLDIRDDIEYKLFCFAGHVEFIKVISYKKGHNNIGSAHYDKYWNNLRFYQADSNGYHIDKTLPKPNFLNEMIELAEKLAAPFNFVRVDFYELKNGQIMFGELTFTPSAGNITFFPDNDKYQHLYGNLFHMPERDENGFAKR